MRNVKRILLLVMLAAIPFLVFGGGGSASSGTGGRVPAKIDSPYALPKFDPPEKFTIFYQLNAKVTATIKDYSEMTVFQEWKKRFGFDFEFVHPVMGRETESLNLMRASGDFPDFTYWQDWTNIANGLESGLREGLITDLTPYLTTHNSPNLVKYFTENPTVKKYALTDSGRFFGYPMVRYNMTTSVVWGFLIREDWVQRVGMRVTDINTVDDLYRAFTLFKTRNINGDGKPVYPYMAKGVELQNSLAMWGITEGFYQKNGKVSFGPAEPEFGTAVSTLAKWYAEGLIDPDYATADVKMGDSLMLNNTSGFYWGETGGISTMYMSTWKDSQPQAKVVGIATPTAASGGRHYTNHNDLIFDGTAMVISKNNKFPVESARFMDFWYSPEGHMIQNFGFEGVTYNMVNGNPTLTEWVTNNPNGLSIDQAVSRHTVGAMNGCYISDSRMREYRMLFFDWQRDSVTRWRTMEAIRMPRVQFTAEESRRLNQIMADINTLRNEMFDKFVMGKEPLSGIGAFTARLKSMGIDEAVAIQQAALDRLNNRR
jgi:putative aldouronate transport system substrate-binding protein